MQTSDYLVIGAGIIGVTLALELKRRNPNASVIVLEKESDVGEHASGRNSGVLHAGFYYSADSLKARFTREGNRRMTDYCLDKKLGINRCGKLVSVRSDAQQASLDELLKRGKTNGIDIYEVTEKEAKELEPRIRTDGRALYSPTTSSVDPAEVLKSLRDDAAALGVEFHFKTCYINLDGKTIQTPKETFEAGYILNTAGLYADRIARDFGFSQNYVILPFKGVYLYSDEAPEAMRTHVYPVPNLKNPFLGVHFTVDVHKHLKIGPTAIPALWREQYSGMDRFRFQEFVDILFRQMGLALHANFDFTSLAVQEVKKYRRTHLVALAAEMANGIQVSQYRRWAKPGIRAQLMKKKERTLEMDFVVEGDSRSLHVLNAVSPAFTCALVFAEHLADTMEQKQNETG